MHFLAQVAGLCLVVSSLMLPGLRVLAMPVTSLVLQKQSTKENILAFNAVEAVFRDKVVVQLGESIHMTNELTSSRLPLVKFLHEQHGFDVMVFEGSAIESWLAADLLLNTKSLDEDTLRQARDIALPYLWRTTPYVELYRYAFESLSSKSPLYLASYDLQPGMGRFRSESLTKLRQAIAKYKPEPPNVEVASRLFDLLADRAKGFPNKNAPDTDELGRAVAAFELWVYDVAPLLDQKFPNVPHGRMLRQLPGMIRSQIELWMRHRFDPESPKFLVFQETRDRLGAGNILKIKDDVARNGKVLVWAHHVHVFHNTLGKARHSLGSDLKRWLGKKLYTIGTFVGQGSCYGLEGEEPLLVDLGKVPAPGLESHLRGLDSNNFFLDFVSVNDAKTRAVLDGETTTRREGGLMPTIAARDFDGALFIHEVTPPAIVGCGPSATDQSEIRLIGGEEAAEGQFPATVHFRFSSTGCTGAKISANTFLTAAHCVVDSRTDAIKSEFKNGARIPLTVSPRQREQNAYTPFTIKSVAVYPQWTWSALYAGFALDVDSPWTSVDVALVVVEEESPTIKFAELYSGQLQADQVITVGGHGCEQVVSQGSRLKFAETTVKALLGTIGTFSYGPTDRETILCSGDSGGPVYTVDQGMLKIVGVNSFSGGSYRRYSGFSRIDHGSAEAVQAWIAAQSRQ